MSVPCGLVCPYFVAYGMFLMWVMFSLEVPSSAAAGVAAGLSRALTLFANKPLYEATQARAMRKDFSWDKTARAYEGIYANAI